MLFKRLTPENQLRLHVEKAREYWRLDRLDLATAAMEKALRAGVPPGPLYDFQRMLEAEQGARLAGTIMRVSENLILEADPGRWGGYWPVLIQTACEAVQQVETTLDARWAKPVLITLIPENEWVTFMRARYGYYAARTDNHKVCLPPNAVSTATMFRRAVLHEASHAAVNQIVGQEVPRWLNEGIAVTMEGGMPWGRRPRRLRLDEISGGFESWDVDLGSPRSHLSYAGAGEFVAALADRIGWRRLGQVLASLRDDPSVEKAVKRHVGAPLRQLERQWLEHGPGALTPG